MTQMRKGLCELIATANSPEEVARLVEVGKDHTYATAGTCRKWSKAAKLRLQELRRARRHVKKGA